MAKYISFFNRQMVMGNDASNSTVYSDVFDVSNATHMDVDLKVYAASGANAYCDVTLEQNQDPSFVNEWTGYGVKVSQTGSGTTSTGWGTIPYRFMRAKLEVSASGFLMVKFTGRADS